MYDRGVVAITRNIRCAECGHRGKIEAHDTGDTPKDRLFTHLGKDPKGYIRLNCPSCNTHLRISPWTAVFVKTLRGFKPKPWHGFVGNWIGRLLMLSVIIIPIVFLVRRCG